MPDEPPEGGTRPLTLERREMGPRTVLTPTGPITYENRQELEALIMEIAAAPRKEIILDCRNVDLMDSEALELMVRAHDTLERQGGALKLVALNEVCNDIMVITRLVNLLHVYDDLNLAVRDAGKK